MSVSDEEQIEYEDWGGFDDPRLPERLWKCLVQVTGDLSGGSRIVTMTIALATDERVPLFYSLEELYMFDTDAVSKDVGFIPNNLGSARIGSRIARMVFSLQGEVSTGLALLAGQNTLARGGMFLGSQRDKLETTTLQWTTTNVDMALFAVWAGGYVWGQRSRSARNGGLLRPPNGLFAR